MSIANNEFDFKDLFIFEMANNHQGSVQHGIRIIQSMADITKKLKIRGAIKLQLRELESFIHPKHRYNSDNKHIPRFLSTRLSEEQFSILVAEIRHNNLISIVTPFDELSVDMIERLGVEVIKIGSCSANDWPLLRRISKTDKPVICSTAGLHIQDIDKVVSFFEHRQVHFALMHCVALYPTPVDKLQLNQIENLCNRYPDVVIGFSTHEEPGDTDPIKVAYAKGARIFEKHVAIPTEDFKINAYSATPEQIADWITAWQKAVEMCGPKNRAPADCSETESLYALARGVYAKKTVQKGAILKRENIYFAMPPEKQQLCSSEWRDGLVADRDYLKDEPISTVVAKNYVPTKGEIIATFIHEIKGMLNTAHVIVGASPNLELSHHYGLARFREWGAAIISCINRAYCKKIIVQLPGQKHPYHHHKKKEEAFQVLYGELFVEIDGVENILYPGDILTVPRGSWHKFRTNMGAVFEEVSTTHFNDDSSYEDISINNLDRAERKTQLINWGTEELDSL